MKKFVVMLVATFAAATAGTVSAVATEAQKWNAELVDPPNQWNICRGSAGIKFGFMVSGDRLIAGNQKTYRGLFETKINQDGSIRQEYVAPGNYRLEITGNVVTREMHLRNVSSGCKWKVVPSR